MSDPLSIMASVAGILSTSITVTRGLHDYYRAFRDQNDSVNRLCNNLDTLSTILISLDKTIKSQEFRSSKQDLLQQVEKSISACGEVVQELREETDKIVTTKEQHKIKDIIKAGRSRLIYPFRESTLQKLREDIEEFRHNLSLALDVLQIIDAKHASQEIDEVKLVLDQVRASQLSNDLRSWLQAPDATTNHHDACNKRHASTGLWFVEGLKYQTWLQNPAWLWLNGFAGCGKSILCSTAINFAIRQRMNTSKKFGICFFYFTFSDQSKQSVMDMLKSIVQQLSHQAQDDNRHLKNLYHSMKQSPPSKASLMNLFRCLLGKFEDVYLFLDAIDEVPMESNREQLLRALLDIHAWKNQSLHVLLTSRNHRDIRDIFIDITEEVAMENSGVDEDIALYVSEHLKRDPMLRKKWGHHRDRIQKALTERAHGMFRWVECQFKALLRCPVSKPALEKLLSSLPRSLDETYERMLLEIDANIEEEARQILTLLSFATRPMFAGEVIDFLATDLSQKEPLRFNEDHRLQDENDLIDICPGFLYVTMDYHEYLPSKKIRIAHFSLQEYLVSHRLRDTPSVSHFYLNSDLAHSQIAQTCLDYLFSGILSNYDQDPEIRADYPLLHYACFNWDYHYRFCQNHAQRPTKLAFDSFVNATETILKWWAIRKCRANAMRRGSFGGMDHGFPTSALDLAAFLGLQDLVKYIIEKAKNNPDSASKLLNENEVRAFNLPCTINIGGYRKENNLRSLQINREDLTSSSSKHHPSSTALHTAVLPGRLDIVNTLLSHGMDVDVEGWTTLRFEESYATPLLSAIWHQQKDIAKYLLSCGANMYLLLKYIKDLELRDDNGVWALFEFLAANDADLLKTLNESQQWSFMRWAIVWGEAKFVTQLLKSGIDIFKHSSEGSLCPLEIAIRHRRYREPISEQKRMDEVIRILLDHLEATKVRGSCCDRPLKESVWTGNFDVTQRLINRAFEDFEQGEYDRLLIDAALVAIVRGCTDIISFLVRKGVNRIQLLRRYFLERIWIQWAIFHNIEDIVRTLAVCDTDMEPDVELLVTSFLGNTDAVRQLTNGKKSLPYASALALAIRKDHFDVAKILYHHTTDKKWALIETCQFGNSQLLEIFDKTVSYWSEEMSQALPIAVGEGLELAVRRFLEHGADLKSLYGNGTLLTIACKRHRVHIVKLLLEWGADVNDDRTNGQTALQFAIESRGKRRATNLLEVVKMLCDAGADLEHLGPKGGWLRYQTPLAFAVEEKVTDVVEYLLDRGAEISYRVLEATGGDPDLLSLLHYRKRLREEDDKTSTFHEKS